MGRAVWGYATIIRIVFIVQFSLFLKGIRLVIDSYSYTNFSYKEESGQDSTLNLHFW